MFTTFVAAIICRFSSTSSANGPELVNPCAAGTQPYASQPWCNASLDIDSRVKDMLSRMTLKEKISNLNTNGNPIASLGLPNYNWWSEASTGVASHSHEATKFAFPITTGMSFNRTLWQVTGRQIGREARALMNMGQGYSTFWAPVINLAREPRWGRNIETPGEDPYQSGEYAEWYVKGMQEAPEDPFHVQASSCCKHYAANSMESTVDGDGEHHTRHDYNAIISQQDLVDSYLLPFQSCVEKGKVTSLMCSYNAINGVPSCANDWLLTTVAREEWGFDGYITSDCDADADVVRSHHYHNDTPEEGVRDVLRAGTDVDCTSYVGSNAQSALDKGLITEADIDERLYYLMRMRIRLDHFDPIGPLQSIREDSICNEYAKTLAQDGAAQGSTLLKNDANTLPFTKDKGSFAVIGPNANLSQSDAGYYGPRNVCDGKFWNMVDAVEQHAGSVTTALGVPSVGSEDTSHIADAVKLAEAADHVVVAVGTDLSWSREGHDATNISFTDAQLALIEQTAAAAKNPIVVVTLTATPLDISSLLANDRIGAILHVGQPSVNTLGVGDVLFGLKPPAGRTIQTIYPASYQNQVSIFDFNMRPGPSPFARPDCHGSPTSCPNGTNPGRTYRFYTDKAVIPFGYGLSYTTWEVKATANVDTFSLAPVKAMIDTTEKSNRVFPSSESRLQDFSNPTVQYDVEVKNTGTISSDYVVLGFLAPPGAGVNGVPLQQLWGFERVHVPAGDSVTVSLYPALSDFAQVDINGKFHAQDGEYKVWFGMKETEDKQMGYAEHRLTAKL